MASTDYDPQGAGSASPRPPGIVWVTLSLRALMETGIVIGLGYWGFQLGSGTATSVLLAIAAPVVGFGFWGAIDFHQSARFGEGLRLAQELAVTGFVAIALWSIGQPVLAVGMAVLSLGYHALLYASGGRLLRRASS